jgi:hypothetical protein
MSHHALVHRTKTCGRNDRTRSVSGLEGSWHSTALQSTYRLRVPAVVPAKDFWSAIVYDTETKAFVCAGPCDTADNRVGLSSFDKPSMKQNGDGSVDLYFGPKARIGLHRSPRSANLCPLVGLSGHKIGAVALDGSQFDPLRTPPGASGSWFRTNCGLIPCSIRSCETAVVQNVETRHVIGKRRKQAFYGNSHLYWLCILLQRHVVSFSLELIFKSYTCTCGANGN